MATRIQFRRGTSTEWTSANPILAEGELGLELDTGRFKVGIGTTSWNSLSYATGIQGLEGSQGTQGTTGSQGSQGTQGLEGSQGTQGTQGTTGTQGTQGTTGSQGTQGTTGSQGTQGTTGSQGSQGIQGSQGTEGSQGTTGSQGTQGTTGTQGTQGTTGTQGTQGTTGTQGTQGTTGTQGTQGTQGTTGSQGTSTLGISTESGVVGTGVTIIDFRGPGISTITVSSGIATVNITGGGGSGTNPWALETENYSAISGDQIIADTSSGSWTLTLPAIPSVGDVIRIADGEDWETNPLTVARNGSTIEGISEDFVLDVKGIIVEFVYDGTTWEIYPSIGVADKIASINDTFTTTLYPIMVSDVGTGYTARISTSGLVFDAVNNRLGIGSTDPGYTLDVNGDINFEGSFYQNGDLFVASRWSAGTGNNIYRLDGNVGIGTTNPQYNLDVLGDINFTGTFRQNGSQFVASRWTSGTGDNIYRLNGNIGVGTTNPTSKLTVAGNAIITGIITCTDVNSTSDANLKTNIQKINNSIEILKQINPVSFNWKDNGKKSYGVIAQELEKVLPELIGEMNGNKTVSYTPLIALLINAILELDKKIEN